MELLKIIDGPEAGYELCNTDAPDCDELIERPEPERETSTWPSLITNSLFSTVHYSNTYPDFSNTTQVSSLSIF